MRSVAPDRPGNEASQNSCSLVNAKPTLGSLATTTDHTIQTANESSRQGTEIHRLRRAIARPPPCQKTGSSGRQSLMPPAAASAPCCAGPWIGCISGSSGSLLGSMPSRNAACSMLRIATCIQRSDTETTRNSSQKQLCQTPVRSLSAPKAIGRTNPPRPPTSPTTPPTAPTRSG